MSGKFSIRNAGNGELQIGEIITDCSCTIANIPNKEIKPGDSLFVTYQVNPHTLGFFQQKIIINNNTDSNNPVMFVIRGKKIL